MLKRAIVGLAATCGTGYADDLGQGLKVFHLESSITYNDICYWNGAGLQFYSEDRALVSQLMKSAQRLEPTFSQREWLEMLAEEEGVCQDYRVRTTEHGINIVYNGSNIFSAMASNYYNLGGAHGNTLRTTAVIDKTNGQLKKLSDFISAPSLAKFKVFLTETLVRRTEEIIGEKIDKPEDYLFLRFSILKFYSYSIH